ncbi:uncharacterized protein LOC105446711 [Strongylocentrotus purpuratus]|uniref:G-protein coupled receptors family 1 profile domain-containing protein n=1 Tax=Strongylocentrotus purpuratus TaxID=7668 RepID=A0A7M7HMR5_STRPU|nr:uncharacterized protein LOC105446711 [Strongylocentrotus purpuratus]
MTVGCLAAAIGIPGNIAIIIVFTCQGIKNATDITFIALAVVDLIASIINGMKIVMVFFHDERPWACYIEVIAARSGLYSGLFLTIWIAVYRYQAVCKPFDRRIGRRAAILVSIGCAITAFGLHVPFFFITTSIKLGREYGCNVYGDISWGRDVYAKTQAIVFCVSALGISVLYIQIYKFIRASQVIRQQMTTGSAFVKTISNDVESLASNKQRALNESASYIEDSCATRAIHQASVSIPLSTISNSTRPSVTSKMKTQDSLPDVESGKTRRATHQPADDKTKPSSKKLKNNQSDHKTTQVVIIITVIFFLLWLPNIVIDQIPIGQLTRILLETHKGSFIIYFFYQIKYISHITNVFVYVFTYRRFRQTCCHPFN